jgi:predicted nucleotide-binding protein
MARKPVAAAKAPLELTVTRVEAKQRLEGRIEKATELKKTEASTEDAFKNFEKEFWKWDSFNVELLKRLFTNEDPADEYSYYGFGVLNMSDPPLGRRVAEQREKIDDKIHRLDSIIERLELIPVSNAAAAPQPVAAGPVGRTVSNKVFVVHGRDEVAKTSLEVFLHEIGLEPVVLHRQADQGMTVIEKFEKHSDVDYAFILLTPDEVAYLASDEAKPDADRTKEKRARPNVIFEFGYFVGKLGRQRVCCLYTGDVTLPSDLGGMVYKKYERSIEEVAYPIQKDLKAAGFRLR